MKSGYIYNNKFAPNGEDVLTSKGVDNWTGFILANNVTPLGTPYQIFSYSDAHDSALYIPKILPLIKQITESHSSWIPITAAGKSVGLSVTDNGHYMIRASCELRTPEEDGSFRWAQLEIKEGGFSKKKRNQGMSNSEGKIGHDYAHIDVVTYAKLERDADYTVALTASDAGVNFRDLELAIILLDPEEAARL